MHLTNRYIELRVFSSIQRTEPRVRNVRRSLIEGLTLPVPSRWLSGGSDAGTSRTRVRCSNH